jgi:hypothetical protein
VKQQHGNLLVYEKKKKEERAKSQSSIVLGTFISNELLSNVLKIDGIVLRSCNTKINFYNLSICKIKFKSAIIVEGLTVLFSL